ncbi:MAG: LPS export ABC transporter periplasmic protein LptC [Spongiibacteraceae bacterium]
MKLLSTRNINTTITAISAVLLLMFLLNFSKTGNPPTLDILAKKIEQPEFYLFNSRSIQYNEQGILDTIITSPHAEQNPKDNSVTLDEPRIHLYRQGQLNWKARAQIGTIYNSGNKVDLEQQVVAISSDQTMSLHTAKLTVFPNTKLAETDQPVALLDSTSSTHATGMKANLDQKTIELLSNVRGQYEPQRAPRNAE